MSTHAVIGFVSGEDYRLQYVHHDGYPDRLGERIFEFINIYGIQAMREMFPKLEQVSQTEDCTDTKLVNAYVESGLADLDVGPRLHHSWYWLLHEAQGELAYIFTHGLRHLCGPSKDWAFDEEYTYIIDLDNEALLYKAQIDNVLYRIPFSKIQEYENASQWTIWNFFEKELPAHAEYVVPQVNDLQVRAFCAVVLNNALRLLENPESYTPDEFKNGLRDLASDLDTLMSEFEAVYL